MVVTLAWGFGGSLQAIADTVQLHICLDLLAVVVAGLGAVMLHRFVRLLVGPKPELDGWVVKPPEPTRPLPAEPAVQADPVAQAEPVVQAEPDAPADPVAGAGQVVAADSGAAAVPVSEPAAADGFRSALTARTTLRRRLPWPGVQEEPTSLLRLSHRAGHR